MRRPTLVLITALVALSACGGDSDSGAVPVPSTTTAPMSSPAASTPAAAAPPATPPAPKCTAGNQAPPSGYTRTKDPPTDFDRDGKPDAIYASGDGLFVAASSGQGAMLDIPTAKPFYRLAGVDPDGDGDQELLVSFNAAYGSRVLVATFADCRVRLATNQQGETYQFKVGSTDNGTTGDGVGCTDADGDGRNELVGLHYERQGNAVRWTRTVVQLRDGKATNGKTDGGTFVSPQDDARIALLGKATCGDQSDFLG